jgi:hypothetical protein
MAFFPRVETLVAVAHQDIDHTDLPLTLEHFQWRTRQAGTYDNLHATF